MSIENIIDAVRCELTNDNCCDLKIVYNVKGKLKGDDQDFFDDVYNYSRRVRDTVW